MVVPALKGIRRFINHQPTTRQQKYNALRTRIMDTFFKYNQKMGAQKIFDYLTNWGITLSLSFVKSVLHIHGLVSRAVKTYKKKNRPHKTYENKLDRQFEISEDAPTSCRLRYYRMAITQRNKGLFVCCARISHTYVQSSATKLH